MAPSALGAEYGYATLCAMEQQENTQNIVRPPSTDTGDNYRLLDTGNMSRLEQIGKYTLVRPAPQAVWKPRELPAAWKQADAVYTRDHSGEGIWQWRKKVNREFDILFSNLALRIKLTNFGHLGLFPEQTDNWEWMRQQIHGRLRYKNAANLHVLNLFAYTGGSTLAASQSGAHVVHVDAAKGVVDWARKNAQLCHLEQRPIRWIVDDVVKFAKREKRRGNRYQGIILDPPSFGRGPKGEVFKIEQDILPLMEELRSLLARDALFIIYSCHTPGFTPILLENQLAEMTQSREGSIESGEMTVMDAFGRQLPSGSYARWLGSTQDKSKS